MSEYQDTKYSTVSDYVYRCVADSLPLEGRDYKLTLSKMDEGTGIFNLKIEPLTTIGLEFSREVVRRVKESQNSDVAVTSSEVRVTPHSDVPVTSSEVRVASHKVRY